MTTTHNANPAVTIIVVSYNTRDMTIECLRSVFDQTTVSFELIVVDNASSDGSADAIEHEFADRITLLRLDQNVGFAAANNAAAEHAHAPRLLLLNPDTVVLDNAIDKLLRFADENPSARLWGGRSVFADRSLNPGTCWSKQTTWSLLSRALGLAAIFPRSTFFNPEAIGGWDRTGTRTVDIISGCFLLIDTELWHELRGFDPQFFMYGEDADLSLRARIAGATPTITGDALIIHHGGQSETVRADKLARLLTAKALLLKRFPPTGGSRLAIKLLLLWPISRFITHAVAAPLRPASRTARDQWSSVLQRRRTWMAGRFEMQPGPTPASQPASEPQRNHPAEASA